ncbi:MAG: flagellar basal body P-ring protein FlgI [Rubripirellula sp.]
MPQLTYMRPSNLGRWIARSLLFVLCLSIAGCTSLLPGKGDDDDNAKLKDLMRAPEAPDLVREATVVQGLRPIQVVGVGAVNGLPGTGGPADPSIYRDQLLEEMKRHDIKDPNRFLERADTALVRIRATIPAGARRGDPVDIRVLAPKESRVSDLHDGWLLDTRMRQQRVLQNMVRQSDVMAIGLGPVLTRSMHSPGDDSTLRIEGVVLGGGRVQVTRKLGLILRPEFQHAKMSTTLSNAVNRRFFFFDGTTRRGIAKPLEDDFIEIEVHPRYRNNIPRLMEVVRAIGVKPESSDTQMRLAELADRLGNPATATDAAMQLEALGDSAVPTLLEGIRSDNPELRFYAAEALAYLERSEAIEPLESAAREVAAFRHLSLLALQGMDHQLATDALRRLMDEPSLETRYGSFCAIRRRVDGKQLLGGKALGSFYLYEVPSESKSAVVVSLRESPEIVLLGGTQKLEVRQFLMGPGGLMIKPDASESGQLRISRFQPGKDDKRAVVSNSLPDVIEGIVTVGGEYGDVIATLRLAKAKGFLTDQLAIDPLPATVRTYYRDEVEEGDDAEGDEIDAEPRENEDRENEDDEALNEVTAGDSE